MALTRLKKVLAASALAVAFNGGASGALADVEPSATTRDVPSAQQRAADRQRRAEAAWTAEQLRAERASRRERPT
jgi:hypothetical protein